MALEIFKFAHFLKFDESLSFLVNKLALQETWSYSDSAKELSEGNNAANFSFPILRNYLEHTFKKIKSEDKIVYTEDKEYCCFNTGLVTPNLEDIFAFFQKKQIVCRKIRILF